MLAQSQVLTFHGIGNPVVPVDAEESRYFVSREIFRQTIAMLDDLERQFSITIPVTFDDGNVSDYDVGLPALADAGRTGRFFVLAGRIGVKGYLSVNQMREIVEAGSSIGCHGFDHLDWSKQDAVGRQREFYDARREIEDAVGEAVTEAAIPFGAFNKSVLHELKKAGYSRVYTSTPGPSYDAAWFCPRWSVTDQFDPVRDLPGRLNLKQKIRGSLFAVLRRIRYRI
jgi:peptidoglycan/xylan/chitin deacetylase (PgdA/CDA1 family)